MPDGFHVQAPLGSPSRGSFTERLSRIPLWLLALLVSPPLVVGLASRLFNGYWWWNDFDAMACAGLHVAQGISAYAGHPLCQGLRPAAFVYPPQVAWTVSGLITTFGLGPVKLVYAALYIVVALWLGRVLYLRATPHAGAKARLLSLGLVTGGVIACGNVAILCHALIVASLLGFRRSRLPFILAVALASAIKPVFAIALVVLILEPAPLRTRLGRIAGAVAALGGLAAVILLTGRGELADWMQALHRTVLIGRPGSGFLGWAAALGAPVGGVGALLAWAVFATIMTGAGAMIVKAAPFRRDEIWLFGLGLAQLINPRLMGYDLPMLAPAVALAMAAAGQLPAPRATAVRWALGLVCFAALSLACAWQVSLADALAPPALCLVLVWLAGDLAVSAFRRRARAHVPLLDSFEAEPMLSLVVCTLDEHESIARVIREASGVLADVPHEIIVVDDSRDDRTAEAVIACLAAFPAVRLIRRLESRGLASAAIEGWSHARGDLLAIMDGDGQHEPSCLRALYDRIRSSGADLAVASRYVQPGGTGLAGLRDGISRAGTALARGALGAPTTDPLSGLFIMRRAWFEAARPRLSAVGFKILVDVMVSGRRQPRVVEVKTALRPRIGGASKLDFRVMADLAALVIDKRTNGLVSARFALFLGVGLTGVAVHLATLQALGAAGAAFYLAQAGAILTAMTSNFFMNNALTFRDLRLKGPAAVRGLFAFYVGCLGGAVVNEALAAAVKQFGGPWSLAALAGILAGAVFNYSLAERLTWRRPSGGTVSLGPPQPFRPILELLALPVGSAPPLTSQNQERGRSAHLAEPNNLIVVEGMDLDPVWVDPRAAGDRAGQGARPRRGHVVGGPGQEGAGGWIVGPTGE